MVDTRNALLVTVDHSNGTDIVYIIKRTVVVEMGIESNRLIVGRTTNVLNARLLILSLVVIQGHNDIFSVIAAPCRLKYCILVIE